MANWKQSAVQTRSLGCGGWALTVEALVAKAPAHPEPPAVRRAAGRLAAGLVVVPSPATQMH